MPLTAQQYYDKVVAALLAGKLPAIVSNSEDPDDARTSCVYRTEDGRACLAGLAIPDAVYRPCMEGTCYSYIGEQAIKESLPTNLAISDLVGLQYIHDSLSLNVKLTGRDFAKAMFVSLNGMLDGKVTRMNIDVFLSKLNDEYPKEVSQCPGTSNA